MPRDNYWKEREQINKNIKRDKELASEIGKELDKLKNTIQREINNELKSYADKEGINVKEAHKRADDFDVKMYEKRAKRYSKEKNFSNRANYELRLYNLKMRMSRLELIKANIGLDLIATFDKIEKHLENEATKDAMQEFKRQAGILNGSIPDDITEIIETVINGSYKNASFSERIWQYQTELKLELEKLLTRAMTNGYNPRKSARELRKMFDVTKDQAERLMRTEQARVQGEMQTKSYIAYGVKEYDIITEPSACKVCTSVASNGPYKVGKEEIAVNMIPLHPNCRCSSVAVSIRDEYEASLRSRGL